jgi:hypothetical protein
VFCAAAFQHAAGTRARSVQQQQQQQQEQEPELSVLLCCSSARGPTSRRMECGERTRRAARARSPPRARGVARRAAARRPLQLPAL